MRLPCSCLTLLLAVSLLQPLAENCAAAPAADIPIYQGATSLVRRVYAKGNPIVPDQFDSASVCLYHLPKETNPITVADYYTTTLVKAGWNQTQIGINEGERYLIFRRAANQMIVHVTQGDTAVLVTALELFGGDGPAGGQQPNTDQRQLDQTLAAVPPGTTLHLVCPAGRVTVNTAPGPDVKCTVKALAAVDYPGLAAGYLKKVQIAVQKNDREIVLGIDPASAMEDGFARLAYDYTVDAPAGVNVQVDVRRSSDSFLVRQFNLSDGMVKVSGALGDVLVATNGPVWVTGATGKVTVNTNSDPVFLRDLSGDVSVHTTGMFIKAYGIKLNGKVDLETSNAQIDATVVSVVGGSLSCTTSGAAVKLHLPADASVDLTVTGADCDGNIAMAPVTGTTAVRRYHGSVNGGDVPVLLETSGGSKVYITNK